MRIVERSIVWRMLGDPGMEHCRLWRHDDGWSLEATVTAVLDDRPTTVRYEVVCDRAWITRSVVIRLVRGSETTTIQLHADKERRWSSAGIDLNHLRGCLDVDLGITPATNTLPIRRLRLSPGESRTIAVVWVRFPGLEIQRMTQTYTRTGNDTYRYESDSGFTAEIEVDDVGMVRLYPGHWETVADE